MTYAIVKYQLMDIKITITRAGIFLTVYTFVLGIPFWVGYIIQSWIFAGASMVILATLGHLIYRNIHKKAEDIFFAEQRRYQKILLEAASGMMRERNLQKLLKLIVYIVKRTVKIKFAAIFIKNEKKEIYELKAIRDSQKIFQEVFFSYQHPFIEFLKEKKEPLLYEELPSSIKDSLKVPFQVSLIIPSFLEDIPLGFLILGEKLNQQRYSQDDINVFKILSHQAALAIMNCIFFEEFRETQRRIFEAEKLASIGGMVDGVAHQIKNRLNQFSLASAELKLKVEKFLNENYGLLKEDKFKEIFRDITEIADSLVENVRRATDIVKGILTYARTTQKDTFFGYFSLDEMVDLSLQLLQVKHQVSYIPLEKRFPLGIQIYGIKAQVTEVIYNLLDNAYEATQ